MSAIQWRLEYLDGTKEEGTENLSKSAFNNPNIKIFQLITDYFISIVNLVDGTITFGIKNGSVVSEFSLFSPYINEELSHTPKYRLIYYRRRKRTIKLNGEVEKEEDYPCIGWQTNDRFGNNVKKIFELSDKITMIDGCE